MKAQFGGESEGRGGGAGWWENGIRARLKGAGSRWGGGGGWEVGGWVGDSWKDEGGRGGIIGTGADARVGIGDSKRRERREEGWAAAETNGATLPRPSWLRASVMDDVFFLFLPVWCAVFDRPPLHLAAAPGYRSGWGRGVWQQQQHSRKRKKNRIF